MSELLIDMRAIARYVLVEALRRKTLIVVAMISLAMLAVHLWGLIEVRGELGGFERLKQAGVDPLEFIAIQTTGLALFGLLFTSTVLAVLLSHSAIRGDAEIGLLQPIVARPIGRSVLVSVRVIVITGIVAFYVWAAWGIVVLNSWLTIDWMPASLFVPPLFLTLAVAAITALTIALSVYLPTTSNGIAVFFIFGAGLGAGMVEQLGAGVPAPWDGVKAVVITIVAPYQRAYASAVGAMTPEQTGVDAAFSQIGPFSSGIEPTVGMAAWVSCWVVAVAWLGMKMLRRRDL